MRYERITPKLFIENRKRLASLLPRNALVVVNANDTCPTSPWRRARRRLRIG